MIRYLYVILVPLAIVAGAVLAGYIAREIIFFRLGSWARRTGSHADQAVISATRGPFIVWWLILGIYVSVEAAGLPKHWVELAHRVLAVLLIGSITFSVANIATGLIRSNSSRLGAALPVTTLTDNITRIVIFSVGFLIILNAMGVSIVPVLATLGVGGIAVALALQDTLASLFGGFYLLFSKQVRVGDFVKLESGAQGYVTDINWRVTRIRTLENCEVFIPNAKLTQTAITNYNLPDKTLAVTVELGVQYDSDLAKVERVTVEVAREVMKGASGGVPGFEPSVRFHTFGEYSILFSVSMRAREFADQYLIKHEFITRLHTRYGKEGIVIPYPTRKIVSDKPCAQP